MSYTTPEALRTALTMRAKRVAAEHDVTVVEVLNAFFFQRFIARVFLTDPDGWLLKGGQALLIRFPGARYTRDIDLYRPGAQDLDEAAAKLIDAARHDADDHLAYEFVDRKDKFDGSRLTRLRFDAKLGRRVMHRVGVDLVVDSRPLGEATTRTLTSAIPIDWPTTWPNVALYPLEDHAADKIIAMYELHKDSRTSSRYRDLIDLMLIALSDTLDGTRLQTAIGCEVGHRQARGIAIDLPDHFKLPSPDWIPAYREIAVNIDPLAAYNTIDRAKPIIEAFLNPVLSREHIGVWQVQGQRWSPASE